MNRKDTSPTLSCTSNNFRKSQHNTQDAEILKKAVIAILILILVFALIYWWTKPSGGFNSGDLEVQLLIDAIIQFKNANNHPPDSLDDLIPDYLEEIRMPEGVVKIDYVVHPEDRTWELIFDTGGCGFISTYYSNGIWSDKFPPPDIAINCKEN